MSLSKLYFILFIALISAKLNEKPSSGSLLKLNSILFQSEPKIFQIKIPEKTDEHQLIKNYVKNRLNNKLKNIKKKRHLIAKNKTLPYTKFYYRMCNFNSPIRSVHNLNPIPIRSHVSPPIIGLQAPLQASNKLGFSVGGAKDINTFRGNVKNGFIPLESSITYNGLFYEYSFDTNNKFLDCVKTFCPSYTKAVDNDEFYISVGLNSNVKASEFKRKNLNLVIVLDISGSMGSYFDEYYHPQKPMQIIPNNPKLTHEMKKTKMQIALNAVVSLLKHLKDNDRFGMVLFNHQGYIGKPLQFIKNTDMNEIISQIKKLTQCGGTNFESGYKLATKLYSNEIFNLNENYDNRIIFLTDAMPNTGKIHPDHLLGLTKANAYGSKQISTTFIGIGVDFNTNLIRFISNIRGANYYSVHSNKEFMKRMDKYFDYMVTPMIFDLKLQVQNTQKSKLSYIINNIYGVEKYEINDTIKDGTLMEVNTLFPSPTVNGKVKGGVILLKLKKISKEPNTLPKLKLIASYAYRNGKKENDIIDVTFDEKKSPYYQSTGIQKAILLTKYVTLLKKWVKFERMQFYNQLVFDGHGHLKKSMWEQTPIKLNVSPKYKKLFGNFILHFKQQMKHFPQDKILFQKELDLLVKLRDF